MKKIYLLALALFAFTYTNAQIIEDDMEFYNLGEMGTQNPTVWTSWTNDGGASNDGMLVVDTQASSGDQSLLSPGDEGRDPVLLLGNQTSGDYSLIWNFYIPTGKEGYLNIQGQTPPVGTAFSGVFNSGNIYFNEANGNPNGITDSNPTSDLSGLTFPHDEWFSVLLYVDVDALTYSFTIGGVTSPDAAFQDDAVLGGINYFPGASVSEMYIDDVLFDDGLLGANDFDTVALSVYPNPVQDILNISTKEAVQNISVYDVLGKLVLQAQPGTVSPTIDMGALSSGAYMVQVTVGNTTKTVKVIK
ncbi:MAG: T9SS type A sorting domain-containing protein [Bacteroidia bacterium]|nr:T9SS type A sorting domain-containing protein [Bacteroidia bacterium]NNF30322.1 T9SS type A sorting domain-containing protein [Flavobacteriaceae bacterium]MBT8276398.1 T9SS type A sorting domain-containing protein [Bacteroidia bacterium]NNJ81757.1 T9SS type A sorting domain-containing protein [Flavobacteriaceae bacterium]NNK53533.1 T9SS type A sorting domain-containing protein [Flavobacteriaceae bacterium]